MLCSLSRYRSITKDNDNFDGDVVEALESAQKLVERRTDRYFEYRDSDGDPIERTETLQMYRNGLVYPKATPVRDVVEPEDAKVDGNAVWGTTAGVASTAMYGWLRYPTNFASGTLTYTGGYEPEDMPEDIVVAVAELAKIALETGKQASNVPSGATSIHVGDVSFTGKNLGASTVDVPDHIYRTLLAWKRKTV